MLPACLSAARTSGLLGAPTISPRGQRLFVTNVEPSGNVMIVRLQWLAQNGHVTFACWRYVKPSSASSPINVLVAGVFSGALAFAAFAFAPAFALAFAMCCWVSSATPMAPMRPG